jgi:hypothetical protein
MQDRKLLLACAWCGPVFALLFAIGFALLAGLIPPPSPEDSPAEIVDFYRDDLTAFRVGACLMMLALLFLPPWGVAMASQTRRTESGFPVLTAIQLICTGVILLTIVIIVLLWAIAAFRPGETSPEITQAINDVAFFTFLFDWTPFSLWVLSFAVAIFLDRGTPPVFPRWAAYLNLWIVLMSIPGTLIVFFKDGPFAFNGFVAFYFPVVVFFIWLVVMTTLTIRAIKSQPA